VTPVELVADAADRIDKVLARHFPGAGRRAIAELFAAGAVRVRGRRAHKGDRVAPGDPITVAHAPETGAALIPIADSDAAARLALLVECPAWIAIAKPAGMPTQPLRAGERETAANGIVARWPECARVALDAGGDPRDGGLVHRLDIGTSGVLIAARTADGYRTLRAAFGAGAIEKTYLAITAARPVSRSCDAALAQRGKRVVVDEAEGLVAHTEFVVERAGPSAALVRCTARTGRMHQVRAHLAHVGAPLVGDSLYGGGDDGGFFLHAASLTLPGEDAITAPVPAAFQAALDRLVSE
jgi:23S rRNA pseudouridine1911/1915/1917 synthase